MQLTRGVRGQRFGGRTHPCDAAHAPKHVRLFANRPNLGFDEASSSTSTQDLELSKADLDGEAAIPLRFVKFQNVNTLTVRSSAEGRAARYEAEG